MASGREYESSQNHDNEVSRPPWKVLSLDGGGVRGLAELLILEKIFRVMEQILTNRGARPKTELKPCDYFDIIGGTSTGGLIAIMLGRLQLELSVTIESFRHISSKIFPTDRRKWTLLKKGSGGFLYDEEAFVTEIKNIIRSRKANVELPLKETSKPKCHVFVCAVIKETGSTELLRSYSSIDDSYSSHSPVTMWEAARATSTAPLLFKPMTIGRPGVSQTMYDGALTDNNPINQVMSECTRLEKERDVGCVVSLGTGVKASAGFQGRDHLVKLVKSLAEQTINCDKTHRRFIQSPAGQHLDDRYFRFSVEKNLDEIKPDQWEKSDAIQAYVNDYVKEHHVQIRTCAELLLSSRVEAPLRPRLDDQRSISAEPTPERNIRSAERLLRDTHPSSISLPISSAAIESRHLVVPRENARFPEARVAAQNRTFSILSDFASVGQFSLLTLEGDPNEQIPREQIANEIKTADSFVERGLFIQAYDEFQLALNHLSQSPKHLHSSLRCDAHLGLAECRISASDHKTKERALEYLQSAEKHAHEALECADEVSRPAVRMSLLAIAIRKAGREAEPGRVDPGQVADLCGQVMEQIEMLRELMVRKDGPARGRNYEGLLNRGDALRRRVEGLGAY